MRRKWFGERNAKDRQYHEEEHGFVRMKKACPLGARRFANRLLLGGQRSQGVEPPSKRAEMLWVILTPSSCNTVSYAVS